MPSKSHGNATVEDATAVSEPNQANVIWSEVEPTAESMQQEYVYAWIDDATGELTFASLDPDGNIVSNVFPIAVENNDTTLIGIGL